MANGCPGLRRMASCAGRQRLVVLPEPVVDHGERVGRHEVARIRGQPGLQRLDDRVLVARHAVVVLVADEEAFVFADAILVRVRLAGMTLAPLEFAEHAVHGGERGVRLREGRIEFDRLLEEGQRLEFTPATPLLEAERIGLERRQRRRGGLRDGRVEPLE